MKNLLVIALVVIVVSIISSAIMFKNKSDPKNCLEAQPVCINTTPMCVCIDKKNCMWVCQ